MKAEPFFLAVIEYALFLELCGDDLLNPDVAVRQMEDLAAILRQLDEETRKSFCSFTAKLADVEMAKQGNSARVQFMRALPTSLQLEP